MQGEVNIIGEPKEGITLRALSENLSDEDGIASISISWETSKDGRNWIGLNSLSGPVLPLTQALVGSQVRARVAVVDNFGIETNLGQATRTVENVNNKPSEELLLEELVNNKINLWSIINEAYSGADKALPDNFF